MVKLSASCGTRSDLMGITITLLNMWERNDLGTNVK